MNFKLKLIFTHSGARPALWGACGREKWLQGGSVSYFQPFCQPLELSPAPDATSPQAPIWRRSKFSSRRAPLAGWVRERERAPPKKVQAAQGFIWLPHLLSPTRCILPCCRHSIKGFVNTPSLQMKTDLSFFSPSDFCEFLDIFSSGLKNLQARKIQALL